jgi:hypothetical protein
MARPARLKLYLRLDADDPVTVGPRGDGEDVVVVFGVDLQAWEGGEGPNPQPQGLVSGARTLANRHAAVARKHI